MTIAAWPEFLRGRSSASDVQREHGNHGNHQPKKASVGEQNGKMAKCLSIVHSYIVNDQRVVTIWATQCHKPTCKLGMVVILAVNMAELAPGVYHSNVFNTT